jgi:sortase A
VPQMTSPILKSFRRRPSVGKIVLRCTEYLFLLLAVVVLGYVVWVQADTFAFQAYQSWRLDQLQQGKPANVALFVKQWIPLPWETDATEPGQTTPVGPAANSVEAASVGSPPLPQIKRATPSGTERSAPSPPAARPSVHDGTLIGRLQIPRLGLSAIVMEGVSARTLRFAVGHVPGTPLPGQPGNVSLSAHRDTFFRELRKIQPGNVITLSTVNGDLHRYRVGAIRVVSPNDVKILDAYSGPGINLITCYPFYYVGPAPQRFIVHADEDGDSVESQAGSRTSVQSRPASTNEAISN